MTAAVLVTHAGLRWFRRGRGRNTVYGVDDGDPNSNDIRSIAFVEGANSGVGRGMSPRFRWRATITSRTGESLTVGFHDRDDAFDWIASHLEVRKWRQP